MSNAFVDIVNGDLENTRQNAREAVKELNEFEDKLGRARSQKSREANQSAIEAICEWLNKYGHKIDKKDYGTYFSSWYLVPTSEEEEEIEAKMRVLKTRHYIDDVARDRSKIVSYLQSLKHKVESKLEDCERGYWELGTNSLSATAREIELLYERMEMVQKIVTEIGDPAGLSDPL